MLDTAFLPDIPVYFTAFSSGRYFRLFSLKKGSGNIITITVPVFPDYVHHIEEHTV